MICGMLATTLFLGGRAHGQTGGTTLTPSDFTILFNGYSSGAWVQMNTTTQQYYFNRARCLCGTDPNGEFEIIVQPAACAAEKIITNLQNNTTGGQGVSYLFASTLGYDCLNPTAYTGGMAIFCTNLIAPSSGYPGTLFSTMAAFASVNYVASPPIPVAYLFNSLSPTCGSTGNCDSTATCSTTATQMNIQFWAQTNSGIGPDFDPGPTATVSLVGYVPVTPTNVVANGGNEALEVSWDWGGDNIATDTTLTGVQLFCQRGADTQVFPTGSYVPAYMTPSTLCPNNTKAVTAAAQAGGPFSNFDPKYLCSGLIPAASTSYRITGLQNGISYSVGVAAVDKYGNIGTIANVVYATPGAGMGGTGGTLGTGGAGGSTRGPDAGLIGTGGTVGAGGSTGSPDAGTSGTGGIVGAGGSIGGPDAEATGGAPGGGGAAGVSPPDGAAGVADAGTGVRFANGCSCTIRGKHDRSETVGILWLAIVTLALALRSVRSRPRVVGRRQLTE